MSAAARFPDECVVLEAAGIEAVFDVFYQAGVGFAADTIAVGIFIGNDFYPGVLSSSTRSPTPRDPPPTAAQATRWPPVSHLARYLRARLSQSPVLTGWALRITNALGIELYDTPGSYIFLRRPTASQGRSLRTPSSTTGA